MCTSGEDKRDKKVMATRIFLSSAQGSLFPGIGVFGNSIKSLKDEAHTF